MPQPTKTLAERMRQSRDEAGLTQEQLAATAGLTAAAIGLIETGDTKAIKAENVFPIARALKKNPEWLATGSGPESPDIHLDKILSALPAEQKLQAIEFTRYLISVNPAPHTESHRLEYLEQLDQLKIKTKNQPSN